LFCIPAAIAVKSSKMSIDQAALRERAVSLMKCEQKLMYWVVSDSLYEALGGCQDAKYMRPCERYRWSIHSKRTRV
jgi:hypothetical protein